MTMTSWAMCRTHRQIVRDEEIGQAHLLLKVQEQVEHLRLHRDGRAPTPARRRPRASDANSGARAIAIR